MRTEPSPRRTIAVTIAALAVLALAPALARADSAHVVFPQTAEVTVVQGTSVPFNLELQAYGATSCDSLTGPVRVDSLYAVDGQGGVTASQPGEIPIQIAEQRGSSGNCYIKTPIEVPMTARAAANTPV